MIDFHAIAYPFFVGLGIISGLAVYYYEVKKYGQTGKHGLKIILGALIGGALGAKLLDILIEREAFLNTISNFGFLWSGRTIVGGLIGGWIGVLLVKKYFGIHERKGNFFAPAIALGVAIGRWGCFFRGCCYGKPTSLPWGMDFGDGVLRHPTQIYESVFMLGMFFWLMSVKDKNKNPGRLFQVLMAAYFTFRFFIEFIRESGVILLGLTAFQIISIFVIIYLILIKNKLHGKLYPAEQAQSSSAR